LEEVQGGDAVDCDVQGVEHAAGAFDVELVGRVFGAVVVEDLVEGFARGIRGGVGGVVEEAEEMC
jgi:hypothetical protein